MLLHGPSTVPTIPGIEFSYEFSRTLSAMATATAGPNDGTVRANFGSTLTLGPLWFTDALGNFIPQRFLSLTSSSGTNFEILDAPPPEAVPEPCSLVLLCIGAMGFGWHAARHRSKRNNFMCAPGNSNRTGLHRPDGRAVS